MPTRGAQHFGGAEIGVSVGLVVQVSESRLGLLRLNNFKHPAPSLRLPVPLRATQTQQTQESAHLATKTRWTRACCSLWAELEWRNLLVGPITHCIIAHFTSASNLKSHRNIMRYFFLPNPKGLAHLENKLFIVSVT